MISLTEIQVWPLLAGLGLFLFGMFMLEEALRALAGRSFKKFLRKHTGHPVKAVLAGSLVTAVLQSSSMVSLLVMSLAGAGIIGLKNGIGMVLGANLGTTVTGWLVSLIGFKLNIGKAILPFLAVGGIGIIFLKSQRLSNISKVLMGFSLMFLGLNYMKEGFEVFSSQMDISFLTDKNPAWFLLFGFVLTAAIQSSSAAMMIFLSSLSAGVITIDLAFYLAIGADLGTSVTAVIGTLQANSIRKKVGWSQFFINAITASVTILVLPLYRYFIDSVLNIQDPLIALVSFHSMFNLVGILLLVPSLGLFTRIIDRLISDREEKISRHITMVNPREPHAATEALYLESVGFIKQTLRYSYRLFHFDIPGEIPHLTHTYTDLKNYENELVTFYIQVQQQALSGDEVQRINSLSAAIRNAALGAKDLKDIKHNLDELSGSPQDDLFDFYNNVRQNQKKFYDELMDIVQSPETYRSSDVLRMREVLKSFYQHETEDVYNLFSKHKRREIVTPSILNMIREINSSNEALIRALQNLLPS
jgi:phosphate:Na+ symporter